MMPAVIEPPAAPPARPSPARSVGKERAASAFDDALREQEAGPPDADTADAKPIDAPVAPDAAPQPVAALDALLAQVFGQTPPQGAPQAAPQPSPPPPAPDRQGVAELATSMRADVAAGLRASAKPSSPAAGAPADGDLAKGLPGVSADASGDLFGADGDVAERQDLSMRDGAPLAPGRGDQGRANPGQSDSGQGAPGQGAPGQGPSGQTAAKSGDRRGDDDPTGGARSVAVRKVTTENHFPVAQDPVRQIATQVVRALDAPASATPAETAANPVKTVNVHLEPESLGAVTVRMRLSGNTLSVRVDVAEPATLEMIQRDRDRLQKTMATGSVSIDRLDIVAAREAAPVQGGDNSNAPKQDMNAPGQHSRQNGGSSGDAPRGGHRSPQQPEPVRTHGQNDDSPRGPDSRSLYL